LDYFFLRMPRARQMIRALVFDWGDTTMRVFPEFSGPMAHWPKVEAVSGIESALKMAKPNYRIALASNAADSGPDLVRDALERVDLEGYFSEVFTARDLGATKPDGGFFKAILQRLDCAPNEVVMVGDHFETDIAGAKRIGLWTIWFNSTGKAIPPNGEGKADAVISSYSELENALLMISGRASRIRH
jgi:putative hydrolase of the HAD superfamily